MQRGPFEDWKLDGIGAGQLQAMRTQAAMTLERQRKAASDRESMAVKVRGDHDDIATALLERLGHTLSAVRHLERQIARINARLAALGDKR